MMKGWRLFGRTVDLREAAAIIFALAAILPFLVVLALLPRSQVLATTEAQIGLLLAFLLAVFGFVVLRRMVGQISKLAQAVKGLTAADRAPLPLDAKVSAIPGLGHVSELGQISEAFGRMLGNVQTSTERLDDLVSKLGALNETVELVAKIPKLEDLLTLVLERTMRTVRATIGSIMLLDHERQTLRVVAARGLPAAVFGGPEVKLGDSIAGKVAQLGQPVLVDNIETDPRFAKTNDPRYGNGSFISLPVRVEDRIIGVINLAKKEYPAGGPSELRPFSFTDLQFLNTLMAHIAYAMDNARLLQDARQSAARLREAIEDLQMAQARLVEGETLRATGQVASGIAHHLNNLLAVISGRVDLLLARVNEPEIRRPLEIVRRSTRAAAEVVRRVRRFTQVQPASETISVDVNELVREALEMARPRFEAQAQARGISIETKLELGRVPPIAGEPVHLREMFLNLLFNAVDALREGGAIAIKTWASEQGVHVSVTDNGVGMSEVVRQRALEPFFTTKGPKGTGLGLSVAHGIIQRHRGELTVESAEGVSTVVTICLPHATTIPSPADPTSTAAVPPLRILVIDDEAEVRETLAETLAAQGHTIIQASGGRDGLARLEAEERLDLVITDLAMPEMNGWAVAGSIKARRSDLPVGLITGFGEEPEESREERARVDFVVGKPFTATSLREAIAMAVHHQSPKG